MPELPEVETARRLLERVLVGRTVSEAIVPEDEIVLKGAQPESIVALLTGAKIEAVGRKGKYFWFDLGDRGILAAHLGMSGAILNLSDERRESVHYKQNKGHGYDEEGNPKYLKLLIRTEDGRATAMADPRRLSRIWAAPSPAEDKGIGALGPDVLYELPDEDWLAEKMKKRNTPIKALLLNQAFLSGIGNWIADEVLYQSGIAPKRHASSLDKKEIKRLHKAIADVARIATEVDADYERFPEDWIFHIRWGGHRGGDVIDGEQVIREQVGGRTTAWVPTRQS